MYPPVPYAILQHLSEVYPYPANAVYVKNIDDIYSSFYLPTLLIQYTS